MPFFFHRPIVVTALSCTAALLLLAGTASAQTETVVANNYLGANGQTTDLKLPTFNTDLGSLESIAITLQFELCPTILVTNSTDAPIAFTMATLTLPIVADGPDGLDSTTTTSADWTRGHAQPGVNSYSPERTAAYATETVSPTDFAAWEGGSGQKLTFALTPGILAAQGIASAPGLTFGGTSTEWAQVTVTYTYTAAAAVPEPSGQILSFIAGVAMLVGMGRKLRSRANAA